MHPASRNDDPAAAAAAAANANASVLEGSSSGGPAISAAESRLIDGIKDVVLGNGLDQTAPATRQSQGGPEDDDAWRRATTGADGRQVPSNFAPLLVAAAHSHRQPTPTTTLELLRAGLASISDVQSQLQAASSDAPAARHALPGQHASTGTGISDDLASIINVALSPRGHNNAAAVTRTGPTTLTAAAASINSQGGNIRNGSALGNGTCSTDTGQTGPQLRGQRKEKQQREEEEEAEEDVAEGCDTSASGGGGGGPTSFPLFPHLPAELRHQIWHHTFQPRVIEIHAPRRPHYAELGMAYWQTRCLPHPALMVCSESRALALKHFRVHAWLASGRLHLDPVRDLVVVLGEMDMSRIRWLLRMMESRDPVGVGLTRLALNASGWEYAGVGRMMRVMSRTIFPVLEDFVLVLYMAHMPPESWRSGTCELYDCREEEGYALFKGGKARELWDGDNWMVVGQNQMKVMGLRFVDGWG